VIELDVHRRHNEIVMIMLQPSEPFHQFALTIAIDIAQAGDALRGLPDAQAFLLQLGTQHISDRFAAIFIATTGDPLVKLVGQLVLK